MEDYKKQFIEFMVDSQVLKFGEFTLKSGRKSPFFMPGPSMITMGLISMYYLALHIKVYR